MRHSLALVLLVAACGGGSDSNDKSVTVTDGSVTTKKDGAGGGGGGDGGAATCLVSSTLSYTQSATPDVEEDANPPADYLSIDDDLNTAALPNTFEVYLAVGNGAFASKAIGPGTYPISGDETDFNKCGACVTIYGELDKDTGDSEQLFQAASGTLTLTSTAGNLTGSLSNVLLKAVSIDENNVQSDDGTGCTVTIASATFNAPITVTPDDFRGKSHIRARLHRK